MFRINTRTMMQRIMTEELSNFHDSESISDVHTDSSDDFKKGNVLFKIPIMKKYMDEMLHTNRNIIADGLENKDHSSYDFHEGEVSKGLFREVTHEVINIKLDANFETCLATIINYKNLLKENFYGALIRSKDKSIINPFHILAALSLITSDEDRAKNYDIIIYVYKNRKELDETLKSHVADSQKIQNNINALMNAYVSRIPTITRANKTATRQDRKSDTITVAKEKKIFDGEDRDASHYIIANQLLTKGIMAPFYGSTLLKMNGDTLGLRLSPFGTCNISSDQNTSVTSGTEPTYDSVCTGSHPRTTLDGLRTLTHANLGSPFSGGFIQNGALAYADAMIEKSIEIYEAAEILEKGINTKLLPNEITPENKFYIKYSEEEMMCTTLFQYFNLAAANSNLPNTAQESRTRYREMTEYRDSDEYANLMQEKAEFEEAQAIQEEHAEVEINPEADEISESDLEAASDLLDNFRVTNDTTLVIPEPDSRTISTYSSMPPSQDYLPGTIIAVLADSSYEVIHFASINGEWEPITRDWDGNLLSTSLSMDAESNPNEIVLEPTLLQQLNDGLSNDFISTVQSDIATQINNQIQQEEEQQQNEEDITNESETTE